MRQAFFRVCFQPLDPCTAPGCSTCDYAVEWVHRCYQSAWRQYKGHPEILVRGRYYRASDDTPDFPGYHHVASRNWQDGEQQFDGLLGEALGPEQVYDFGIPPEHRPLPKLVGSLECIAGGETELPIPLLRLIRSEAVGPVIVTGDMPSVRVDFGEVTLPFAHAPLILTGDIVAEANATGLEGPVSLAGDVVAEANATDLEEPVILAGDCESNAADVVTAEAPVVFGGVVESATANELESIIILIGDVDGVANAAETAGGGIVLGGDAEGVANAAELDDGGAVFAGDVEGVANAAEIAGGGAAVFAGDVEGVANAAEVASGGAAVFAGDLETESAAEPTIHWSTAAPPTTGTNSLYRTDTSGGTWKMLMALDEFDPGEWTDPIAWDADAAAVAAAVAATAVGAHVVSVTGSGTFADPWVIEYVDAFTVFGVASVDDSTLT